MHRMWGFAVSFVAGLVLGLALTTFAPRYLAPYLPPDFRGRIDGIEGTVATKEKESDRLILTVHTDEGAILATFKKRITEIDILAAVGDRITFVRKGYRAFLEDPEIGRVRKKESLREQTRGTQPAPAPAEPDLNDPVLQ